MSRDPSFSAIAKVALRVFELQGVAARVRDSIERVQRDDVVQFARFPAGSCAYASLVLGEYLLRNGFGRWTMESGVRRGSSISHAWLEQDGWILDITADQFPEQEERVIYTRESPWHAKFSSRMASQAGDLSRDFTTEKLITRIYDRVVDDLAARPQG